MTSPPTFRPLTGIYEPSAIVQLPDGRFLVVEDEKEHPLSLAAIHADGRAESSPLEAGWLDFDGRFWKLDDLEGLALGPGGFVHAVTSHSRDGDGDEKKARDKLVRFRVEADRVVDRAVSRGLKPALIAAHPALAAAAGVRDVKNDGGLNIEALEVGPDGDSLLVGLRGPLLDGRAIVVRIGPLAALFDEGAPRPDTELMTLDLDGNGLRGMTVLPEGGYLLIAGPVGRRVVPFRLWHWSGRAGDPARRVEVAGQADLAHAEGVCPAVIDGRPFLVVVSDDGDRKAGRCAGFLLLDPDAVRIVE